MPPKKDIAAEIETDPEMKEGSSLLYLVIETIEDKIQNKKDLNTLSEKEKVGIAAHLHFLQLLLEDFFYFDEEFDGEEEEEDGEEFEWNEAEKE